MAVQNGKTAGFMVEMEKDSCVTLVLFEVSGSPFCVAKSTFVAISKIQTMVTFP